MSFTIEHVGGFNPFAWDALRCPLCKGNEFIGYDHTQVYCSQCGAEFSVRHTAGDPGCVVDCFITNVYAPLWECLDCGTRRSFFEWQKPVCPKSNGHTMKRVKAVSKPWKRPKGYPRSYYLILKLGDYCSGWLGDNWVKDSSQKLGFPSQEEWDKFQKSQKIVWRRSGAR